MELVLKPNKVFHRTFSLRSKMLQFDTSCYTVPSLGQIGQTTIAVLPLNKCVWGGGVNQSTITICPTGKIAGRNDRLYEGEIP
jgi:hypothetical protein